MAYKLLPTTTPIIMNDRLLNIETEIASLENPSLTGTHIFAGEFVPNAATSGTDTAGVATVIWVGELRINRNTLITGLAFLIGSVGGTDSAIAALYDSTGKVVANSALAGTTVGTLATFQSLAFVAAYQASPGLYYVGISTNGTTAKLRTIPMSVTYAGQITGQTFGTLATITPPTTFTASMAPIVCTY